MINKIGIMQGRLLPRYQNRYQSHPLHYWQAEFYIARDLDFSQIEFILDFNDSHLNPLMSKAGIKEIQTLINATGVKVKSVCADYFMEAPFHSIHQQQSEEILKTLISNAADLGVIDIVIPCVDHSTLKNDTDMEMLIGSIHKILPFAEEQHININFETDLNPKRFKELLNHFDSNNIKVNYDIGNSSSLGFNPQEEFDAYGEYISDLHIKDRVLNGGSVELGKGNADFDTIFQRLQQLNFQGNIIMQSARELDYVNDLTLVQKQKLFLEHYIAKYLGT